MILVRNIRVRSLDTGRLYISWEIGNTFEDVLDYDFRIQRSESPEGPWDTLTETFVDKYQFVDNRVDVMTRKHRQWFYRIEAVNRRTSESALFGPSHRSPRPDLIAIEQRRQAALMLRTVMGRRAWLFPVRTFGQQCTSCYDPVTHQRAGAQCRECYGTTFSRGYMDPIEVWVQFEPTPKTSVTTDSERTEETPIARAHVAYYPEVKPNDLLVEAENRRWEVASVEAPERLRAPVRQDLTLTELNAGDPAFDVPLDVQDLLTSDFANPFNFRPSRDVEGRVPWT